MIIKTHAKLHKQQKKRWLQRHVENRQNSLDLAHKFNMHIMKR